MPREGKPGDFEECAALSRDWAALNDYLRARLVELTKAENSVAVKAIELLLALPVADVGVDLATVSNEELRIGRERAFAWIKGLGGSGGEVDHE
jgi:hypothetical protein